MQDPITGSKLYYNTSNSQEARSSKDKQIKSQNSPRLQFQHNQDILKECMLLGVAVHGCNIWKLKQEAFHKSETAWDIPQHLLQKQTSKIGVMSQNLRGGNIRSLRPDCSLGDPVKVYIQI